MNSRPQTKILLVSKNENTISFFDTLLGGAEFDLHHEKSAEKAADTVGRLNPDLILHSVDITEAAPLVTLCRLLVRHRTPVLLVSSNPGSCESIVERGIKIGALDLVEIPESIEGLSDARIQRIARQIAGAAARKTAPVSLKDVLAVLRERTADTAGLESEIIESAGEPDARNALDRRFDIVGVAISTGGPSALSRLVPRLPAEFPAPILVVQHIIPGFIGGIAQRLDSTCAVNVKIAEDGEQLHSGSIYFSPDKMHLKAVWNGGRLCASLDAKPDNVLYRPSADILFESIAAACKSRTLAVMMTGMGQDGLKGLRLIKDAGGVTIAQDKASSAIYGMARAAVDANLIDHIVPLNSIAAEIYRSMFDSSGAGDATVSYTERHK